MMTFLTRMDAATLIVWSLALMAGVTVLFFISTLIVQGKRSKRIKSVISQHRSELGAMQSDAMSRPSSLRQNRNRLHVELAQKFISSLNLQNLLTATEVKDFLASAGLRGRQAIILYVSARLIGAAAGFSLTLIFIGLMKTFPYPEIVKYMFAGGGAGVGFFLPKILVANKVQNRQDEMTQAFPDTLDLMLICVESGLGIEMAFSRVTDEIMENSPILAQELGLTSAELAFLGDRRQAFKNFANRTGLPAAKALSTTLIQSEEYGTPIGTALKVLAQEKRDERMSAAEKKAASLPAKLTVPMIIFFLPVLFIVVIGPAALSIGN